jgi:Uma2 family endonuclease
MTGAEFDALPWDEGRRWELIEGELVEVGSATLEHQFIVQRLLVALVLYFREHGRGFAAVDVEFALSAASRLRPDVLIVLGERATTIDRSKVPVLGAPDIAVEVISPSERTPDSMSKVEAYLRNGTREVWQVFPKLRQVVIFTGRESRRLTATETLTTGLLPDFALPVSSLFDD